MTAPERRRPLPALAFIAALTVLTALVWFRVIHRTDDSAGAAGTSCPTGSRSAAPAKLAVLPVAANVSVAVLNASERKNLAKQTKALLKTRGFTVTIAVNDEPAYGGHGIIKTTGEIRYGPTAKAAATLLHYYLPSAKMVVTDQSTPVVYLAVGTKYKTLRNTVAVSHVLAAAHVKLTKGAVPTPSPTASRSC